MPQPEPQQHARDFQPRFDIFIGVSIGTLLAVLVMANLVDRSSTMGAIVGATGIAWTIGTPLGGLYTLFGRPARSRAAIPRASTRT